MPIAGERITNTLFATYSTNLINYNQNLNGIISIWNNPNDYGGTKKYKYQNTGNDPVAVSVAVDNFIYASYTNSLKNNAVTVANRCNTQFGNYVTTTNTVTVAPGDIDKASDINTIVDVINQIQGVLSSYNGWWDSQNYCARSCQISCQSACQLACQGCITSQCHNQNCGTS